MSLTTGRGPFSREPGGRFTVDMPENIVYIEPHRRRVRAKVNGLKVIDSDRVLLVHRPGQPPSYSFPSGDVTRVPFEPDADTPDYVSVPWNAVDSWFEEEEEVFGHPRNPYHRVDSLRSNRRLHVSAAGISLVDTERTIVVYETALDPRLYVDPAVIRMDLLRRSDTHTYCPYKGSASYWHAQIGDIELEDVAWSYEEPLPEAMTLQHLLSFDESRVSVVHNLRSAD
jgi:uncharacterized protein (DUF427 family)